MSRCRNSMTIKNRFSVASIDPQKVEDILRECAETCILPYFGKLQDHEVNTKSGPNDLVTVADKKSEAFLEQALLSLYPSSTLIGEEGIAEGRMSTDVLREKPDAFVWVTDPVDGTWNFRHAKDMFCVMLACVQGGETVAGWIYDPVGGRMMAAEKGGGAFINGTRLSVAEEKPLAQTEGFIAYEYISKKLRPFAKDLEQHAGKIHTLRCAGHEYLRLASGAADFAMYSKIRAWDHLPGTLAVKEAGGQVLKWDGTTYKPGDEFGGILIASTPTLLRDLQQHAVNKMVVEYKKSL